MFITDDFGDEVHSNSYTGVKSKGTYGFTAEWYAMSILYASIAVL